MMGGGAAEEVRYTAFLLDEDSRLALLRWASEVDSSLALPPDWTTRADHLTIWHRPTPERMAGYDLCGFRCELRVLGLAKDHRALAVHVEVPDFVPTPDAEVRAPRPFVPRETKTIELTRPDGPRAHPSPPRPNPEPGSPRHRRARPRGEGRSERGDARGRHEDRDIPRDAVVEAAGAHGPARVGGRERRASLRVDQRRRVGTRVGTRVTAEVARR